MDSENQRIVASERAIEKRYAEQLAEKARALTANVAGPRNNRWTGDGQPRKRELPIGRLIGRVALGAPDEECLDGRADFYVGVGYAEFDGIEVFNWTTPFARSFFRAPGDTGTCDNAAVIRTFQHQRDQIVDFVDERLREDAPTDPFPARELKAPKSRVRRPLRATQSGSRRSPERSESAAPPPRTKPDPAAPLHAGVRAEPLLKAALAAPRTKGLCPVLATLQPDQFDLVTLPAMESVIIEGQPGTGKTIIASHRAAYLVDKDTPPENTLDGGVLVVGPTPAYSAHVRGVIEGLSAGSERIKVLSTAEFLARILDARELPVGEVTVVPEDGDAVLGQLAAWAVETYRARKRTTPTSKDAYEFLRAHGAAVARDAAWEAYIHRLPPYPQAMNQRRHILLLAAIRWQVARPPSLTGIEHIIVDEAQDLTPLEWFLLQAINEAGQWTILGDLNQRRSSHTLSSWDQILDIIVPAGEAPVRRLERAYRSTRPILEYANKLLPRDQRALTPFQENGPDPVVVRSNADLLGQSIVSQLQRLLRKYPDGTLAIISANPDVVRKELRQARWVGDGGKGQAWTSHDREILALHHDEARGLEFDAVIVVEPSAFPKYFAKFGPLYTALTRANRELVIVHCKPLPDKLKRTGSRTQNSVTSGKQQTTTSVDREVVSQPDSRYPTCAQEQHIRRLCSQVGYDADELIARLRSRNYHHAVSYAIDCLEHGRRP